jgi:hypothetical protein
MGVLDDAIREHLELKRQHGVPEEELQRQEEEALGPARRDVTQQPEDGAAAEAGTAETAGDGAAPAGDETALFDGEQGDAEPLEADDAPVHEAVSEAPAVEETVVEPSPVEEAVSEAPAVEAPPVEDSIAEEPPVEEPVAEAPPVEAPPAEPTPVEPPPVEPPPEEPPQEEPPAAGEPDRDDLLGDTEPHGFPALEEEEEEAEGEEMDLDEELDVLEDTPDFLQETPEHDRLWFEQKPPRDFDFD